MRSVGRVDPPAYTWAIRSRKRSRAMLVRMGRCQTQRRAQPVVEFPFERESTRWTIRKGRRAANGKRAGQRPRQGQSTMTREVGAARFGWRPTSVPGRHTKLIKIKAGKEIKVETAEGHAPDFSREEGTFPSDRWLPSP